MRTRRTFDLRRIASGLMLLAAFAFVLQGALVGVSQAAAVLGVMPGPAVALSGETHYHGGLARQAHVHDTSDKAAGHRHVPSDADQQQSDDEATTTLWSLGCTSGVIPIGAACSLALESTSTVWHLPNDYIAAAEPDGLTRPPCTPSIA